MPYLAHLATECRLDMCRLGLCRLPQQRLALHMGPNERVTICNGLGLGLGFDIGVGVCN